MLGCYNYTVILTYLGTLSGFIGITFASRGLPYPALICLMISGFCDMFDGRISATMDRTQQEKRFGIQIDSLSDLVCFGVLPALTVYSICGSLLRYFVPAVYLLCALIRLAWFNVDEEMRQDTEAGSRDVYLGLPVTCSALILPIIFEICRAGRLPLDVICPVFLIITAAAFLTPFRLKKPALVGKLIMLIIGAAVFFLTILGVNV